MSPPNEKAKPRRPPLSAKYAITVMTDDLLTYPNATAYRVFVGAAGYHGAADAWLPTVGHRQALYFTVGESYKTYLNRDFAHLIGNETPLWTLFILDPSKTYIAKFLLPVH